MAIWVVADDEDLSAVLQSVAIEAGLDVECMDAEEAGTRLDAGSSPTAMLMTRSAFSPDRSGQLEHIPRLAVASAMPDWETDDGLTHGVRLLLPAGLDDIERTLLWLDWDGATVGQSASRPASSARA